MKRKRLIADLKDGKFLSMLFFPKEETTDSKPHTMFVITGEPAPHLKYLSMAEGIQIVREAGFHYTIDEIDDDAQQWWK